MAHPPASSQHQPALPPPQTFDILPALHELLSRIDHQQTLSLSSSDTPASTTADGPVVGTGYTDSPSLEPKELPAEVLAIKAKIRRALRELEKLPDMDRSVAEQQEEIAELEDRVKRQREMVRKLGVEGARFGG